MNEHGWKIAFSALLCAAGYVASAAMRGGQGREPQRHPEREARHQ